MIQSAKTGRLRNCSEQGYASLALVAAIGGIVVMGLVLAFRGASNAHDSQNDTQTRVDLAQVEDAFLRSLIAIVPNKAVDTMREENTALWPELSWTSIFQEAFQLALGGQYSDAEIAAALIGDGLISANRGEVFLSWDPDRFAPVLNVGSGTVNSGTMTSQALVDDTEYEGRLPDPLTASAVTMERDADYPIISWDKEFSSAYQTDAQLSVSDYPLYNQIPYPRIQFGFARPGDPFVAKRNWWAFTVHYGKDTAHPLTKHYVFSIYEVPSQAPISSASLTMLGAHSDGSAWQNATLTGSVSTGSAMTSSNFQVTNGGLAVRNWADIASGTQLSGNNFDTTFDNLGVREVRRIAMGDDANLLSLAANSGRTAFIPINPALDFYRIPVSLETQTLSATGWKRYSRGAAQCAMTVKIVQVAEELVQTPTELEFTFKTGATATTTINLTRGDNWPDDTEPNGNLIPFQTEHLESGREALVFFPERLEAFVDAEGGAGPTINHSLVINPDPSSSILVKEPEFPTVGTDIAVVLRECADFSPFTKGFALVTNLRLYLGDDFNQVSIPAPSGAGVPSGEPYYPPVGLFAPEKRYGTTLKYRPVEFTGQVGSLTRDDTYAAHPLDFRAGTHETITPNLIEADLKRIVSPAQLPPVHVMNWLVTIEELRSKNL